MVDLDGEYLLRSDYIERNLDPRTTAAMARRATANPPTGFVCKSSSGRNWWREKWSDPDGVVDQIIQKVPSGKLRLQLSENLDLRK